MYLHVCIYMYAFSVCTCVYLHVCFYCIFIHMFTVFKSMNICMYASSVFTYMYLHVQYLSACKYKYVNTNM